MDAHVYGRQCCVCGTKINGVGEQEWFCIPCGRDFDREEAKRAEYEKRHPYQEEGFDDEPYFDGGRISDADGGL